MQKFRTRLLKISSYALVGLLLTSPAAHAFADDEARRAILELRAQIKQINEQSQQARIQLANQMDQLNQEVASLRGQLERLTSGGAGSATTDNHSNAPKATPGADPQERLVYESAADLYRNGRYQEAASGFASFVESYPDSPMASDALFYLGSSQYAAKDFKNSIQTMQKLVRQYPNDPRAADALLVAATNQIELNDLNAAKASLQRIIADYPNSQAAETAKSRLKML